MGRGLERSRCWNLEVVGWLLSAVPVGRISKSRWTQAREKGWEAAEELWGLCEKRQRHTRKRLEEVDPETADGDGTCPEPAQHLPGQGFCPVPGPLVSTVRRVHPVPPFLFSFVWFSTPRGLIHCILGSRTAAACQGADGRGAGARLGALRTLAALGVRA